jgi:hypothetical protein
MLNAKYMHGAKHCQEELAFTSTGGLRFTVKRMKKKKEKEKDPHAVHLGQLGGRARKRKLTPERRREIAQKAAEARWAKSERNRTP